MEESKDLKAGDTTSYEVGGKVLTLTPVTLGKMKKAMAAFTKTNADSFEMIEEHLVEVLANGKNPFATREWIQNNVTMPIATKIIEDLRRINGMEVFRTGVAPEPREMRPLDEVVPTH